MKLSACLRELDLFAGNVYAISLKILTPRVGCV